MCDVILNALPPGAVAWFVDGARGDVKRARSHTVFHVDGGGGRQEVLNPLEKVQVSRAYRTYVHYEPDECAAGKKRFAPFSWNSMWA